MSVPGREGRGPGAALVNEDRGCRRAVYDARWNHWKPGHDIV